MQMLLKQGYVASRLKLSLSDFYGHYSLTATQYAFLKWQ